MKVLLINAEFAKGGGPATIVRGICEQIISDGGDVMVAYGLQSNSNQNVKMYKIGSKTDRYLHAISTRVFDNHGRSSWVATKRLIKEIEKFKPDIVNLHNIHGYYINYKLLFEYLTLKDIPLVWTLHDCWAFTGHCAYFDRVDCKKWMTKCENCVQLSEYPKTLVFDRSSVNFEDKKYSFLQPKKMVIVTPSVWLKDLVSKSFLKKYSCKVIYNGIDLDVFKYTKSDFAKKYGLLNKKIVLGVASTWDERKGLKEFIGLSRLLSDKYKIVIVGVDEKQKQKLPKSILTITRTENINKLVEIYSAADVFVNPTYEDNFPTVNLEALACGTPVIAYNTGGCREQILSNCGNIVPRGNIVKLKEEIEQICKEEKNIEACKESVKHFEKQKAYKNYLDLFSDMLSKNLQGDKNFRNDV